MVGAAVGVRRRTHDPTPRRPSGQGRYQIGTRSGEVDKRRSSIISVPDRVRSRSPGPERAIWTRPAQASARFAAPGGVSRQRATGWHRSSGRRRLSACVAPRVLAADLPGDSYFINFAGPGTAPARPSRVMGESFARQADRARRSPSRPRHASGEAGRRRPRTRRRRQGRALQRRPVVVDGLRWTAAAGAVAVGWARILCVSLFRRNGEVVIAGTDWCDRRALEGRPRGAYNPEQMDRRGPVSIRHSAFTLACGFGVLLLGPAPLAGCRQAATAGGPTVFIWAWERPEDLTFIDPARVGVAFLASTIRLDPTGAAILPRAQPLQLRLGTSLVAVVRIEGRSAGPTEGSQGWDEAIRCLLDAAALPHVNELQIDFDATTSQRPYYRTLISSLRARLPNPYRLSITALASWCLDDAWISQLPVDEAVPMLFQMGREGQLVRTELAAGRDFAPRVCRLSVGLSTDEPPSALPRGRRRFYFNSVPWTKPAVDRLLESAP